KRHIAGNDWKREGAAGFTDAADAADQLAHDFRPLGVAEIEVVSDGERLATDSGDVAPSFRDRLLAALERIGLALARRHVSRECQRLGPVKNAHDRGIATRPLHGIAQYDVVVLLPHPASGAQLRGADQRQQRLGGRHWRLHGSRCDYRLLRAVSKWALVDRRLVAELFDWQIGHDLAAMAHHKPLAPRPESDDRQIQTPLP